MKTRILSAILSVITLIGIIPLASCGDKTPPPEKSKVDHVYKATPIEAGDISVGKITSAGDKLLVYADEFLSRDPYETQEIFLLVDPTTGEFEKEVLKNDEDSHDYIQEIASLQDGTLLFLMQSWDEKTEKSAYKTALYKDGAKTPLCDDVGALFDATGDNSAFGGSHMYIEFLAVDKDDNIYVATDYAVVVVDKTFKKLFEIEINGYIRSLGATFDGRVYASFRDYDTNDSRICYIDTAKKAFGDPVPLPDTSHMYNTEFYVGEGYDIYYKDDSSIYGFNTADAEPTELMNFINSDVNPNNVRNVAVIDADNMLIYTNSYSDEEEPELLLMKRIPEDQIPEKYIIHAAYTPNGSGDLASVVVKFNRASDEYRVELIDYTKYGTDDDYYGSEYLKNQIIAGTAPDVIELTSFSNSDDLIAQKAFTDLGKLIEKDETFDRSKYFASVLAASTDADGKMYQFITGFSLNTYIASKDYVDFDSWDAKKFIDFTSNLPEGKWLTPRDDRQGLLDLALSCSMDSFIDYKKATCDFESDEFKKLLEILKKNGDRSFMDSMTVDEQNDFYDNEDTFYQSGKLLLYRENYMGDIASYAQCTTIFGDVTKAVFLGYPTNSGNGALINPQSSYAITEKSRLKEGAWEFIKQLSTYTSNRRGGFSIPASIEGFSKSCESEIGRWYLFRINGWSSFGDNDMTYEEVLERVKKYNDEGTLVQISEDHVNAFIELINGAQGRPSTDDKIFEMINEEAEAYYSDAKTLDETVKIIQNRVSTYIAERS